MLKPYLKLPHQAMIDCGGDDLGSVWYTFKNISIAKAVNVIDVSHLATYKIVDIKQWRKYWFFGPKLIHILLEDPERIEKLKGTQHFSGHFGHRVPDPWYSEAKLDRLKHNPI